MQQSPVGNNEQKLYGMTDRKKTESRLQNSNNTNSQPMNMLLLYVYDWHYNTLLVTGYPIVRTPNIDALAHEGVHSTNNCVTTYIYWISQATL